MASREEWLADGQKKMTGRVRILGCLPWEDSFASETRGGKKDKPVWEWKVRTSSSRRTEA